MGKFNTHTKNPGLQKSDYISDSSETYRAKPRICGKILGVIYLDYSANHPVRKEVLDAFVKTEETFFGNANSLHALGREAEGEYERLNRSVLSLLGLSPEAYEIIYTSSATESNNTVIKGVFDAYSGFGKHILTSQFEHSSVNGTLSYLKNKGADVEFIETEGDGKLSLEDFAKKLRGDTILVTCPFVESEVGTVQPVHEIQKLIERYPNSHFLCDATQGIGKIPFACEGLDFVSFAPHKFGGIIGTGVLVKKKNIVLTPLLHGGKSASIYRSSTLPLGLVSSVECALRLALSEEGEHGAKVSKLNKRLREEMARIPGVILNSPVGNPYILNFSVQGKKGADTVSYFSQHGICLSQKSACSILNTPSKPVMAIYHDKKRAFESVRVSLSYLTTEEEIDTFLSVLKEYTK